MLEIDLGFTGPRQGMTEAQRWAFRRLARNFYGQFHEGDCVGADADAASIIDDIGGFFIHVHPPRSSQWRANYIPTSKYRMWEEKNYGDRDLDIVIESDVMVATPSGRTEKKRGSGTWLTIRLARAELRPLAIIYPTGDIIYERWSKMFPRVG